MANLGGMFDANNHDPAQERTLLPPGKYLAQIVESEMKDTKGGSGQMLSLTMEILEGPEKGRKIWDNLNLKNPNQQTVEIAQRTLSAICHAIGRLQVSDSDDLHFEPMLVSVAVEDDKRDKDLEPHERRKRNTVKGYAKAEGAMAARPHAAPRPAPAAPSKPNGPWRRSA